MLLRDARTFGAQPGTKTWFSADDRYEMHVSRMRSEMAQEFAREGRFRAGLGDVVCTYRKLRRTPWLAPGVRVSMHDPQSAFGSLALLTPKQIAEVARELDPAHAQEAARLLQLCAPKTRTRAVNFVVEWSDNAEGPKTKEQREAYAQDYAANARTRKPSKGSGSTVVGWCVLRMIKADPEQFWSDMFRVYETEIFTTREFAAFATASGIPMLASVPDTDTPIVRFLDDDEEEEEDEKEWPREVEIERDAETNDFIVKDAEDASAPGFRASLREIERYLLSVDKTGAQYEDFLEAAEHS